MRFLSVAMVCAALAGGPAFASDPKRDDPNQIGNRNVARCVNFYSLEKEIALGKQLANEVRRQSKVSDDPILGEYVNRLGQNLARHSDAKLPFTFQVVEDENPNAFALPGGFIFVNTGLMKIASEEDEFAGAVAHEIAHVAARHMTCSATRQQIAGILSIPAAIALGGGWGGYAGQQALGIAVPTMFLKFSRGAESEADYLGTQYMYAAGYDPNGAISIFEKLESLRRNQPGFFERVLSTHPMDSDRIHKTQEEIQRILPAKGEYVVTTSEYREMRERLIAKHQPRKSDDPARRPTLKTAPGAAQPEQDGDDRPTIRRRELVE